MCSDDALLYAKVKKAPLGAYETSELIAKYRRIVTPLF